MTEQEKIDALTNSYTKGQYSGIKMAIETILEGINNFKEDVLAREEKFDEEASKAD